MNAADLGWHVEHDAPNYFPDEMTSHVVTIRPGEEGFDFIATQRDVDENHPALVAFNPSGIDPVDLVDMDGTLYLTDGHHRMAGAQVTGQPLPARVWTAPED